MKIPMMRQRWLPGLAAVLCSGCQPVSNAWITGWTGAEANDRIMLVRQDPPSLGHRRLVSQSGIYPDLDIFLKARGMPDFLAETSSGDHHFLLVYYLDSRTAYACRAKAPSTRLVDFSGPYAITEREYTLLQGFKNNPGHASPPD